MEVRHDDEDLIDAERDPAYRGTWTALVVRFRKVMNLVRQAQNETELYNWKGLRLEKLKGNRNHQHSMRLNDQWRLIVEFESNPGANRNVCAVKGIEKHYE